MSVHYKFKNTKDYDAVKFDGVYISAADLKSIIVQQKKLGNSELQVENEETKQLYTDDQLIPKNTNVVVSRLPFANSNKRTRSLASQHHHHNSHHHHNNHHHHHHNNNHHHHQTASTSTSASSSSSDQHGSSGGGREALELVSTKNMSEEEKIKYIQSQSTKDFDPTRYARSNRGSHRSGGRGRLFVPGPGYTCRKCGIPGHSIYDCRMSAMHKVKRSSGIPRDFLMKVDSKEKGALMTPSGEYAVPFIDREAYNNPKVEKAPFFEDGTPSDESAPSSATARS